MPKTYRGASGSTVTVRPGGTVARPRAGALSPADQAMIAYEVGKFLYPYAKKGGKALYKYATTPKKGGTKSAPKKPSAAAMREGSNSQVTRASRVTQVGRRMTASKKTMMLTRANLERLVYRWNGVKAFNGNGYYWMSNKTIDANTRALPLYLFDLTSVNNISAGTSIKAIPMLQLQQDNVAGAMAFTQVQGLKGDGATLTSNLNVEVQTAVGTGTGLNLPAPYTKSVLESASIKLNCWGAVSKSTRWQLSVVRFSDQDLVPTHGTYAVDLAAANTKRSDLFQSLIKSLTFNPISTSGGSFNKRMKVIKSMMFTIEPQQTTDSDTDPSVKSVSWTLKLNKLLDFTERAEVLANITDTNDQADYVEQTGAVIKAQIKPTSRLYLMIRSTNYGLDATESNVLTPSFDLSIKLNHSVTQ
uniref:Capsid protein n=1 Tax=Emberiza rustica CRESS-DNA-virus sp. TaxID=2815032 RepID=A0A8A4XAX7_9VIRU|nr:MAG: capsid protein [Emberiza rustica CRESS-DNA-virus sp.]